MIDNNNKISKENEKERKINHLINLVEKQTRTKRHVEQNADKISSKENLENAQEVQRKRQDEINNLKDIFVKGDSKIDMREQIERRFLNTEEYLNHNAERMDDVTFQNSKVKQEHRKEELDNLE